MSGVKFNCMRQKTLDFLPGFVSSKSKVPSLHWSHSDPSTLGLHIHSDVSYWEKIVKGKGKFKVD